MVSALGFKARMDSSLLHVLSPAGDGFLSFTSVVIPTDLFAATQGLFFSIIDRCSAPKGLFLHYYRQGVLHQQVCFSSIIDRVFCTSRFVLQYYRQGVLYQQVCFSSIIDRVFYTSRFVLQYYRQGVLHQQVCFSSVIDRVF